jgi:hypothetical protein
MRTEENNPAKKVLCIKPERDRERRRSRPKLRWYDEVEEDVARVGFRHWRINAQSSD